MSDPDYAPDEPQDGEETDTSPAGTDNTDEQNKGTAPGTGGPGEGQPADGGAGTASGFPGF